jgi:hypothetical protein
VGVPPSRASLLQPEPDGRTPFLVRPAHSGRSNLPQGTPRWMGTKAGATQDEQGRASSPPGREPAGSNHTALPVARFVPADVDYERSRPTGWTEIDLSGARMSIIALRHPGLYTLRT